MTQNARALPRVVIARLVDDHVLPDSPVSARAYGDHIVVLYRQAATELEIALAVGDQLARWHRGTELLTGIP